MDNVRSKYNAKFNFKKLTHKYSFFFENDQIPNYLEICLFINDLLFSWPVQNIQCHKFKKSKNLPNVAVKN